MSNTTYQPKVYRDQGGDREVIAPGGTLLIEGTVSGLAPGTDFFVDATNGSNSNDGLSWANAVATLDYAIGLCTASSGDRIFLAPWHAESLTTATEVNCDVAGVEIIGVCRGRQMPTFTTDAAAGSITVGAANVTLRNLKMVAGYAGGSTSAITIGAAGDSCTLDGIVCRDSAANTEWLVHVSVATTVDELHIKNCDFRGLIGESMTNSILFAGTSTNCTIEDCYIHVDSSDDTVDHLAGAAVGFRMSRCVIVNEDTTTALYCVRQKSDGTGVHHDCRFAYNKVDAEVSLGAASWWLENRASNTIAEGTILEPAATHAIP